MRLSPAGHQPSISWSRGLLLLLLLLLLMMNYYFYKIKTLHQYKIKPVIDMCPVFANKSDRKLNKHQVQKFIVLKVKNKKQKL